MNNKSVYMLKTIFNILKFFILYKHINFMLKKIIKIIKIKIKGVILKYLFY